MLFGVLGPLPFFVVLFDVVVLFRMLALNVILECRQPLFGSRKLVSVARTFAFKFNLAKLKTYGTNIRESENIPA